MRRPRFVRACVIAALAAGCATGNVDVSIPDRKTPERFTEATGGPSAATTPWRGWLADHRLEALVAEAIANNQDLQIALQRIEIARAGVQAATGTLLPQVAAGVGASLTKFGRYTMDGAGNRGTEIAPGRTTPVNLPSYAFGLQASWEIDLWGRLRNQREATVSRYLASIEGTNLVLSSLVADVAASYFELLALDHARDVLEQAVARQERAVEVIRLQKEAGRANELAVAQFEAQLAETRAEAREAQQRIVEEESRLNMLLGRHPRPIARGKEALFAEPRNNQNDDVGVGLPSDLLRNRPDIREAELRVAASKLDVRAARAAFFPSFNMTAALGYEAFNPAYLLKTPASVAYSVTGGLIAPLVNRRALAAQFSAAKAEQVQAMYEYQRAIVHAYAEVTTALANLRSSGAILTLRQEQKAAAERTVTTSDMLHRAAKATYLEVLLAQQSALRADLDLVYAWKRRHIARIVIWKALGGGWR